MLVSLDTTFKEIFSSFVVIFSQLPTSVGNFTSDIDCVGGLWCTSYAHLMVRGKGFQGFF